MLAPAPRLPRFALAGIAAVLAVTASMAADAAPIFKTNFDGANGTTPADTTIREGALANGAISNNEFRTLNSSSIVRLVYSGDGASSLTDYTVDATFRRGGPSGWTGLVARAQTSAGDLSGYYVRLNRATVGAPYDRFELRRLDVDGTEAILGTAIFTENAYPAPEAWRMTLTVDGTSIAAKLFNASGTEVAHVSATDGTFTSGTGGLRALHGQVSVYQDLSILEVPEPASLGLVGLGALALVSRRWR